jgi:hypothetical protein
MLEWGERDDTISWPEREGLILGNQACCYMSKQMFILRILFGMLWEDFIGKVHIEFCFMSTSKLCQRCAEFGVGVRLHEWGGLTHMIQCFLLCLQCLFRLLSILVGYAQLKLSCRD